MSFPQAPQKYDPHWPAIYKAEATAITLACGDFIQRIEHIGSTAIAGMIAKPIIDILISVKQNKLQSLIAPMQKLQFTSRGENGIPSRAYFSKPAGENQLAVHVHCFEEGHEAIDKHIAFRNYLIGHPEVADQYRKLKMEILSKPNIDRDTYQNLKSDFLIQTTALAVEWMKTGKLGI